MGISHSKEKKEGEENDEGISSLCSGSDEATYKTDHSNTYVYVDSSNDERNIAKKERQELKETLKKIFGVEQTNNAKGSVSNTTTKSNPTPGGDSIHAMVLLGGGGGGGEKK
jgi:predicted ribonuclease toxin of YeeF-YezG toxin-antitoxin module